MSSNCYYCGGHPDEVIDLRRRVAELEAECNRWAEASIAEDGRRAAWRAALQDIAKDSGYAATLARSALSFTNGDRNRG